LAKFATKHPQEHQWLKHCLANGLENGKINGLTKCLSQGILTDGEGLVWLTLLQKLVSLKKYF
jgi:hypothetical protein